MREVGQALGVLDARHRTRTQPHAGASAAARRRRDTGFAVQQPGPRPPRTSRCAAAAPGRDSRHAPAPAAPPGRAHRPPAATRPAAPRGRRHARSRALHAAAKRRSASAAPRAPLRARPACCCSPWPAPELAGWTLGGGRLERRADRATRPPEGGTRGRRRGARGRRGGRGGSAWPGSARPTTPIEALGCPPQPPTGAGSRARDDARRPGRARPPARRAPTRSPARDLGDPPGLRGRAPRPSRTALRRAEGAYERLARSAGNGNRSAYRRAVDEREGRRGATVDRAP